MTPSSSHPSADSGRVFTAQTSHRNRVSAVIGSRRSALSSRPTPDCEARQVLIRVIVNGVCASDLAEWQSDPPADPLLLGHEPVGEVVAVGPGVDTCDIGDLVTGRIDPSFSDFALADQTDVVKVPPGLTPDAALGEPLGCIVEALRRTPLEVGDRIAVVGAGFMGLCLLQLLRHTPSSVIAAIDPRTDARAHALRHGADTAADPAALSALDPSPPGAEPGFDVVFEASGSQPGLDLATELVRPQGTLSIIGYHQGLRTVDMHAWNWKALDVVNAHVRDRARLRDSIKRGLELAAAGRIDLASLITHRYALSEVDTAFTALIEKPSGFIKAVIDVN
jgi:threonine dehydrogenase-like Zn-dependent dehydrogenase